MRQAGTRLRALIAAGFGVFLSLTAAQALDRGRLATQSDVAALPASAVHNPFEGDASVVPEGRSVFNQYCSHCHAPNAMNPDPSRDLRRLWLRYGDKMAEVFHTTVMHGRPDKGMPNWNGTLNEETLWKIFNFLQSIQTKS